MTLTAFETTSRRRVYPCGPLGILVLRLKPIQYVFSLLNQTFTLWIETPISRTRAENRATSFQVGNLLNAIPDVPQPLPQPSLF